MTSNAFPGKNNKHFVSHNNRSKLTIASARGSAVTITAQVVMFMSKIGSTVVLARLLTPKDFGLFAMVTRQSFSGSL